MNRAGLRGGDGQGRLSLSRLVVGGPYLRLLLHCSGSSYIRQRLAGQRKPGFNINGYLTSMYVSKFSMSRMPGAPFLPLRLTSRRDMPLAWPGVVPSSGIPTT